MQADDGRLITGSSTSLAANGSSHHPRPPDGPTPCPPDGPAPSLTPRPPDSHTAHSPGRASNRSTSVAVSVSINKCARNSSHASAPLGNSTPRQPDSRKNHGRHGDKKNQEKRTSPVAIGKRRIMVNTLRGMSVVARNDKDGLYYPGGSTVRKV